MDFKGWKLFARLLGKQADEMGENLAALKAASNPELATAVDREMRAERLRKAAVILEQTREAYDKEAYDVVVAQQRIEADEAIIKQMQANPEAYGEEKIVAFLDNYEQQKAQLEIEIQERDAAKEILDVAEEAVRINTKWLADYDRVAKEAINENKRAKIQAELENMRSEQLTALNNLKGGAKVMTGIEALKAATSKTKAETGAQRVLNDINEKPQKQEDAIEEIRKAAAPVESLQDRLARLASK